MKLKLPVSVLKLLLLIAVTAVGCVLRAQDSTIIKVRHFDNAAIESYRQQPAFSYETAVAENLDFFSLIMHYLEKFFGDLFSTNQEWTINRVLVYGLMIVSLLVIVLNLLGVDLRRVLLREPQTAQIGAIAEEDIREMDIDELIAAAFANKQWRLCVRYQYLKALRVLTDRDFIHWQPGKTNMDYYAELKNAEARNAFLDVTGEFENAWYGNREVTEEGYLQALKNFEDFYGMINRYQTK